MSDMDMLHPPRTEQRFTALAFDFIGYATLSYAVIFMIHLFTFGAMGDYAPAERIRYLQSLPTFYALYFLQHFVWNALMGASPAEAIAGLRLVDQGGQSRPLFALFKRALIATLIFPTLIILPGPLTGFAMGPESATLSVVLLLLGVITASVLGAVPFKGTQKLTEALTGLRLVQRR